MWNAEDFTTGLAGYPDKDVVIEGLAVFRPSGKLLRIDADAINPAGVQDSFFSRLPLAGAVVDHGLAVRVRPGQSAYSSLLGMIPGEETDEELNSSTGGNGLMAGGGYYLLDGKFTTAKVRSVTARAISL